MSQEVRTIEDAYARHTSDEFTEYGQQYKDWVFVGDCLRVGIVAVAIEHGDDDLIENLKQNGLDAIPIPKAETFKVLKELRQDLGSLAMQHSEVVQQQLQDRLTQDTMSAIRIQQRESARRAFWNGFASVFGIPPKK